MLYYRFEVLGNTLRRTLKFWEFGSGPELVYEFFEDFFVLGGLAQGVAVWRNLRRENRDLGHVRSRQNAQ